MTLSGGDEFLKKLEQLKQQQTNTNNIATPDLDDTNNTDINELDDIIINKTNNNKQKYIMFGISLVLLFILTIVILKFLTNDDDIKQDELIKEEPILETDYALEFDVQLQLDKKLDINKIEQKELPQDTTKTTTTTVKEKDPLEITKEEDFEEEIPKEDKKESIIQKIKHQNKKQEAKSIKPKVESKKPKAKSQKPKVETKNQKPKTKSKKPQGYYIQVGAFTKKPSPTLLLRLKSMKLPHTLYKMKVKGRLFTKVLIGPYPSKIKALDDLNMIRQITKNPQAFIIRFK